MTPPRPVERWFALALGLLLVGVGVYGGVIVAREGGGALRGLVALALGALGVDAIVASLRNRRALIAGVGPLP